MWNNLAKKINGICDEYDLCCSFGRTYRGELTARITFPLSAVCNIDQYKTALKAAHNLNGVIVTGAVIATPKGESMYIDITEILDICNTGGH